MEGTAFANRRLLELATIDGVGALGLADVTGMVTLGKAADLIVSRDDQLNMAPLVVPNLAAVDCTRPEHVDTVVVNGRIVKRNGALTVANSARVAHDRSVERSGLA